MVGYTHRPAGFVCPGICVGNRTDTTVIFMEFLTSIQKYENAHLGDEVNVILSFVMKSTAFVGKHEYPILNLLSTSSVTPAKVT